jgi:hypothetical protein
MMNHSAPEPSFSPRRKWVIGLRVVLLSLVVLSIVFMANLLSRDYFARLHLSDRTRIQLSSRTAHFVRTITNQVMITIYYDKSDPLYSTISDLLNEYRLLNANLAVQTVDYLRDAGAAQKVKNTYQLAASSDKNLVIFEVAKSKFKTVDGNALAQYTLEQVPGAQDPQYRRKPVAFLGEMAFTAALLDVTNPKPLTAYFLQGHLEHEIDSGDEVNGYLNFASYLKQNYIRVLPLSLAGTNTIPADCNLLVISGPRQTIPEPELQRIDEYLAQGGRLLALFNAASLNRATGLESILGKWGVAVGNNVVVDPEHSQFGSDVIVSAFTANKHPVTNPLLGGGLYLVQPRTISKLSIENPIADAPKVEELAFSGQNSFLLGEPGRKRLFPLMAAVEHSGVKGVITERGHTRMLVVGDSVFLANRQFDLLGNRDFAGYAANWLLDRTQLIEGVGPRSVKEYRLVMSKAQLQAAQWLLLAGMPGSLLALGVLVWFRRRH